MASSGCLCDLAEELEGKASVGDSNMWTYARARGWGRRRRTRRRSPMRTRQASGTQATLAEHRSHGRHIAATASGMSPNAGFAEGSKPPPVDPGRTAVAGVGRSRTASSRLEARKLQAVCVLLHDLPAAA